jgi:exopolysaccharide biosynthesis protein
MKELGCTDALNLDGGGSSILLYDGRILNHPSDIIGPRPVPVMFGVQRKR